MGKPKSKPRKPAMEENEFLIDLIDEVKAMEGADDSSSDEHSYAPSYGVLSPSGEEDGHHKDHGIFNTEQDGSGGIASGNSEAPDEMPTLFSNLKKHSSESPKLRLDINGKSNESSREKASDKSQDKTIATNDPFVIQPTSTAAQSTNATSTLANKEADRTVAVSGARGHKPLLQEKVVSGSLKGTRNGQVYTSLDASLAQAETLKLAQGRIKELEMELDKMRLENDDLASAGDVVTRRMEEIQTRMQRLEKEKRELSEQSKNELLILKGNLQYKDSELSKSKAKLEDLDSRIKSDFRKIRVRERELENRLELVRGEKQALMRAKDDKILDLQRKLDQYKSELDLYRVKVQDLNKMMESQHDQMQKTIRALRVALVNLEPDEAHESTRAQGMTSGHSDSREDNRDESEENE